MPIVETAMTDRIPQGSEGQQCILLRRWQTLSVGVLACHLREFGVLVEALGRAGTGLRSR
jgi:hypothetical protein